MKVVVIGGTGLIGSKVVARLGEHGHEAVAAAPNTGVNTLTGEGLAEALEGAAVVVDVSNSPSFDDDPVLEFFRTSTTNLLECSAKAGVGHTASGRPLNGIREIGGPEQFQLAELVRKGLAARGDSREVVVDEQATYYGVRLSERMLLPGPDARLGEITFDKWLAQQ